MSSGNQSGVFSLSSDGKALVALRETPYDAEAVLQQLIADFPQLLSPEDQPWLLLRKEASLSFGESGDSAGWLDHLFVDGSGVLTLVEVKRASDTRIRREVVAQLLDYAANARHTWGDGTLRAWHEELAGALDADPEERLRSAFPHISDYDAFWQTVSTNLAADRLRLVIVADVIPSSLRAIVEYLNRRMTETEVLAIEVRQFVDESGSHTMLVPQVIGDTEQAAATKSPRTGSYWEPEQTLAKLREEHGDEDAATAESLLDWARARGWDVWRGRGTKTGAFSCGPKLATGTMLVFTVWTSGTIEFTFQYMQRHPPFDDEARRATLRDELNGIAGVSLPDDCLGRRPNVPLNLFRESAARDALLEVLGTAG